MKKKYTIPAIIIIAIALMLIIEAVIQTTENKRNSRNTLEVLLNQVISVIEDNKISETTLIENLKEEYILRAQTVAYMLTENPDVIKNTEELRNIAALAKVDEINIFDDTGMIYAGTVEDYFGLSVDDGDQIHYFAPMLEDKSLTMCQDMVPNTARGTSMMYAMTWNEDKSFMVQIGIEPVTLEEEMRENDISEVVDSMPMYSGVNIIVAETSDGNIVAATGENELGRQLDDLDLKLEADGSSFGRGHISGTAVYYTAGAASEYTVVVCQNIRTVDNGLILSLTIVLVYLSLAALILALVIHGAQKSVQAEKDKSLHNLKRELAMIEGITFEYTDIILIDFTINKTCTVKAAGETMDFNPDIASNWRDYDSTWSNYVAKYLVSDDRTRILELVKADNVIGALKNSKEYNSTYRLAYMGRVINYQVKFVKIYDGDKEYYIAAFRGIDEILETQKKIDRLEIAANVDGLTGLYNRRAYEKDIACFDAIPPEENFVYVSFDVNGLKKINDTLGHAAGDELLVAAADCLMKAFGANGKLYRIGGDEFAAIIFAGEEQLESMRRDLESLTDNYKGQFVDNFNIACGFAPRWELPMANIIELSKIADKRMYEAKRQFYMNSGVDRRGQRDAFDIICKSYTKILRCNLTEDTFTVIQMEDREKNSAMGYSETSLSKWLKSFAESGLVAENDRDKYLANTDISYVRNYFKQGNKVLAFKYSRRIDDAYKLVMMQIVPDRNYSDDEQRVFLYVKDIEG